MDGFFISSFLVSFCPDPSFSMSIPSTFISYLIGKRLPCCSERCILLLSQMCRILQKMVLSCFCQMASSNQSDRPHKLRLELQFPLCNAMVIRFPHEDVIC